MQTRDKSRLCLLAKRNGSAFYQMFGGSRGMMTITGDIVSADPELWDCELGIAYHDENNVPFGYDGKEVDMIEAVKNAR